MVKIETGFDPTCEYTGGEGGGFGRFRYHNGDLFEGQYKDGKKEGKGKLSWADGDVYEGAWHNDKMHGHAARPPPADWELVELHACLAPPL